MQFTIIESPEKSNDEKLQIVGVTDLTLDTENLHAVYVVKFKNNGNKKIVFQCRNFRLVNAGKLHSADFCSKAISSEAQKYHESFFTRCDVLYSYGKRSITQSTPTVERFIEILPNEAITISFSLSLPPETHKYIREHGNLDGVDVQTFDLYIVV